MSFGQRPELVFIAAYQDRIGHNHLVRTDFYSTLISDGQDRADEMLVGAHPAGDAVHNNANMVCFHKVILFTHEIRDWQSVRYPYFK